MHVRLISALYFKQALSAYWSQHCPLVMCDITHSTLQFGWSYSKMLQALGSLFSFLSNIMDKNARHTSWNKYVLVSS